MCFGSFGPFREVSPFLLSDTPPGTHLSHSSMLAELRVLTLLFEFGGVSRVCGPWEEGREMQRSEWESKTAKSIRPRIDKAHASQEALVGFLFGGGG